MNEDSELLEQERGIRAMYVLGKILQLLGHLAPADRQITLLRANVLVKAAGDSPGCPDAPLFPYNL